MKMLIGALALILAAPVAAQAAPAADPHAGHAQHQQQPSGAPSEHKMDCKCCEEMKQHAGKMECCEHAEGHADHGSQPTQ